LLGHYTPAGLRAVDFLGVDFRKWMGCEG